MVFYVRCTPSNFEVESLTLPLNQGGTGGFDIGAALLDFLDKEGGLFLKILFLLHFFIIK